MQINPINNSIYEPRYRKVEPVRSADLKSNSKAAKDAKNSFGQSFKESMNKKPKK